MTLIRITILCTMLAASGCGVYRLGSTMDPDLGTIAIGTVANETREPMLTSYFRNEVPAMFMRDGSLQVVNGSADCVLQARITGYNLRQIGEEETISNDEDQRLNRTVIWGVDVNVEYEVLRADGTAYIPTTVATGKAEFSELIDLEVVRKDGLRQAIYDAADQIVTAVTNPW
jgi:hypothetical protein